MKIVETYSHLNGLEYLLVHRKSLWDEIQSVVTAVNANRCRIKISKEKRMKGKALFAPKEMNRLMKTGFERRGWSESRTSYWVTSDAELIRKTLQMPAEEQKEEILASGKEAIYSYNQTDFVKDRVAVEVQLGKYSFVAFDLFVKHMAFFVRA